MLILKKLYIWIHPRKREYELKGANHVSLINYPNAFSSWRNQNFIHVPESTDMIVV